MIFNFGICIVFMQIPANSSKFHSQDIIQWHKHSPRPVKFWGKLFDLNWYLCVHIFCLTFQAANLQKILNRVQEFFSSVSKYFIHFNHIYYAATFFWYFMSNEVNGHKYSDIYHFNRTKSYLLLGQLCQQPLTCNCSMCDHFVFC